VYEQHFAGLLLIVTDEKCVNVIKSTNLRRNWRKTWMHEWVTLLQLVEIMRSLRSCDCWRLCDRSWLCDLVCDTMAVTVRCLVQPVVQMTSLNYLCSWDEHRACLWHEHGAYLLSCPDISKILARLFYDIFYLSKSDCMLFQEQSSILR